MGFTRVINFHADLLNDLDRTEAFRQAIMKTVREGDVVVDVGCGMGILSFFACQAGARHVYAIDRGPIIKMAQDLARMNGFVERITFLKGKSRDIELPEQADVIISETLWNIGLGEGILPTLYDAVKRWLKPGGEIIPQSIDLMIAPLQDAAVYDDIDVAAYAYGLDLTLLRKSAFNAVQIGTIREDSLLSPLQHVLAIDFKQIVARGTLDMTAQFTMEEPATLHAFMGCFTAVLAEGIAISNQPPNLLDNWDQAIFALEHPAQVEPGDQVTFTVTTYYINDTLWVWSTEIERGDGTKMLLKQSSVQAQFDLVGKKKENQSS